MAHLICAEIALGAQSQIIKIYATFDAKRTDKRLPRRPKIISAKDIIRESRCKKMLKQYAPSYGDRYSTMR